MNVQEKLQLAEVEINGALVERDVEVKLAMIGLVTKSHVFLGGEPGLGKSHLAELIGKLIGGSKFQVLMNKNTDPDELFGPVSCRELFDNDELVRKVDGFLPTANVAILDEIFNASPIYCRMPTEKVVIWHLHGSKHCTRAEAMTIWPPVFWECWRKNVAKIQEWALKIGDTRLSHYVTHCPAKVKVEI